MDLQEPSIDDLIKGLPTKQKVPVIALKKLLDQREAIDEQQEKKINETKLKYNKMIQPLLQRASQIIRGGAIKKQEVANADQFMKPGQKYQSHLKGKVIEGYWNGVFSNSGLVDEINEEDEKALSYLLDVQQVGNQKDLESIELKFVFKENPYFKEKQLVRKLIIKKGEVLCLEGNNLTWKDGQCLTHKLKKVTNKKTGEKSTIKGEKMDGFFDIFMDYNKENEDQLKRVADMMTQIQSYVLMDSIDYFLGVINADQESDDDEDMEEDEEEK